MSEPVDHDTLPPSIDPAAADHVVEPPRNLRGIVKQLGPGLIIAGSIVGSGELIATTKTGAQAGIALLWLVIIGCVIKVFVQVELGRYTICHGETTLAALDQVPGPRLRVNWIVWFWLAMMLVGIGQLGGIVGGVGQSLALSFPLSGDYAAAIRMPSRSQLVRYLRYDDALLTEWDLDLWMRHKETGASERVASDKNAVDRWTHRVAERIAGRLRALRSTSAREIQDLLKAAEELFAAEASLAALQPTPEAGRDEIRTARDRLHRTGQELQRLIVRLNEDYLSRVEPGSRRRDAGLQELKQMTHERRSRILRGHAILSRQLRRLDEEDRRAAQALVAVADVVEAESAQARLVETGATSGDLATARQRVEDKSLVVAMLIEPTTRDDKYWAAAVAVFTAVLLYRGRYSLIQNVSLALVVSFTLITIGNVISLQSTDQWYISITDVKRGLSFMLPEAADNKRPLTTALATFGIIGVGASELIAYPYWCLEKGYAKYTGVRTAEESWARRARGWMRVMHYDAFLSMVIYTVATLAFFLMGVAVLFNEGRDPDGMRMVSTLATAYVPVFGEYAGWLFLVGAVAVLYSTFMVANAQNARLYTDAMKIYGLMSHHNQKAHDRAVAIFSVGLPLLCLAVFWVGLNPVQAILISGTMQALLLPMIGVGALYFRYTRTDERMRPSRLWDVLLAVSCVGLLVAGAWGAYGRLFE